MKKHLITLRIPSSSRSLSVGGLICLVLMCPTVNDYHVLPHYCLSRLIICSSSASFLPSRKDINVMIIRSRSHNVMIMSSHMQQSESTGLTRHYIQIWSLECCYHYTCYCWVGCFFFSRKFAILKIIIVSDVICLSNYYWLVQISVGFLLNKKWLLGVWCLYYLLHCRYKITSHNYFNNLVIFASVMSFTYN